MKLQNTFVQGKMNKDMDERLLPKGQYPHAENIRVANSDGADMGAIENIRGNKQLTSLNLTNAKAIGALADDSNQKIYWFVTSDDKDLVIEYDVKNISTNILLQSSRPDGVLNFDEKYLITGVNKIINEDSDKDLLFWTDDLNPPRVINIERFKGSALDSFTEDDISVIKAPPTNAPTYTFSLTTESSIDSMEDKWFSFAYRFEYEDGMYSALSSFSNYAFSPNQLDIDIDTLENRGMANQFNALNITMNTGSKNVVGVELVVKESNSNALFIVERFNKEERGFGDDEDFVYKFLNDKTYTQLPEDELFRSYDNVPLVAKAQEYIGNRIAYGNYVEGFDMVSADGKKVTMDYALSLVSTPLEGTVLPNTLINSSSTIAIDLTDLVLNQDVRLNIFFGMSGVSPNIAVYNESFVFILERDYVDLADLTSSPEFTSFIEETMTTVFFTNETSTPPADVAESVNTGFTFALVGNELQVTLPSTTYTVDNTPADNDITDGDVTIITYNWIFTAGLSEVSFNLERTSASIKSLRNLELGVIYMDAYNRRSPVQVGINNTIDVPITLAEQQNKLKVTLNNQPPADAVRYKFAVKQNRGFYYNVFCTKFFIDGQFTWVKLEEASKDKVSAGDVLYVKRDTTGILDSVVKVTVLEVTFKAQNFIENNFFNQATGELVETGGTGVEEIIEPAGTYMKIKTIGFTMDYNGNRFFKEEYFNDRDDGLPRKKVTGLRNATDFFPIEQGATITINISNSVERTTRIAKAKRTYIAGNAYASFRDFYVAEVGLAPIVPDAGTASPSSTFAVDDQGDGIRFSAIFDGYGKRRTANIKINLTIENANGLTVFETIPDANISEIFYETSETFEIIDGKHQGKEQNQTDSLPAISTLDFYNCFAMGEGVESVTYLDGFNKPSLNIDLRPSTTSLAEFRRVRRFADITYSEAYNENTSLNGLNEFNLGRANFKDDLDKKYGFIQRLYSRDTDLVVFQEDKVSYILYGKTLLLNADGSSNVSSIEDVLGQQVMYTGEYGISRNPESFDFDGVNLYFIDSKRGCVCRLGRNGITEISEAGMRRWFIDEFKDAIDNKKLGAFDPYLNQYVVHSSSEVLSVPRMIPCSSQVSFSNFSVQELFIDFDIFIGQAGFDYSSNGVPVKYDIEWNGQTFTTGYVGDASYNDELNNLGLGNVVGSGNGTFTFDKTESLPRNIKVTITAPICGAEINIDGNCVQREDLTVTRIILTDEGDTDKFVTSKYRWFNDTFLSPFKQYNEQISENEVEVFDTESGAEGSNDIPLTNSVVRMESFIGLQEDLEWFEGENRMGYLISNNQYDEAQLQDILDNATFLTETQIVGADGEVTRFVEFDYDRTVETYLYLIWDYRNEIVAINANTKIRMYFDSSGSMDSTLTPLQTMRDTILKDRLLPLYDNDETLYDNNVTIIEDPSERTMQTLNMNGDTPDGNVIVLVFQDEASTIYHSTSISPRTAAFDNDLLNFRARLNSFAENYYRGVIFQVEGSSVFKSLIQAVQLGTGDYSGNNGLSDRNEFNYKYDLIDGSTPEYYLNQIVIALQELGYEL